LDQQLRVHSSLRMNDLRLVRKPPLSFDYDSAGCHVVCYFAVLARSIAFHFLSFVYRVSRSSTRQATNVVKDSDRAKHQAQSALERIER
jgi:hypothetical protein